SIAITVFLAAAGTALPQSEGKARGLAAWDTGKPSAEPIAPAALAAKQGWTALEKETPALKGDAVLTNGRIAVVVRRNAGVADLYAVTESDSVQRTKITLIAASGEPAAKLDKLALVEVAKGALTLEIGGKTAKGAA